ncbi:MAG TPA: T9SS type A sorting domain-containing protein [Bacteroidales bacterium]|nr:T9SS type A sorting domain-containing protein [Bacteroidales bacterium]
MKRIVLFAVLLLTFSITKGQWTIVGNITDNIQNIHYKSPCIFLGKRMIFNGVLVSCNDNPFVTSFNGLQNIVVVQDIDSHGDTIFCNDTNIYFSADQGSNWNLFDNTTFRRGKLLINNNFLFCTHINGDTCKIKRYNLSTGETALLVLPVTGFEVSSFYSYNNEIYIGVWAGGDVYGYLYRSTNLGDSWSLIIYLPPSNPPYNSGHTIDAITKINDSILIIAGSFGMKISFNNGSSFSNVSYFGQGQSHSLFNVNGTLLLGCDNGVYISYDTAITWQAFNDGLNPSTGIWEIKKIENYIYMATSQGLYRRPVSEISTNIQQIDNNPPQFSIFPTICKDKIFIKLSGNTPSENELKIYDCLGRQVFESSFKVNELQIDISALKAGIYFVEIRNGNFQKTEKIIVE